MTEGDTWERRENLENAQELVKEFEREYGKDNREVRKQEREENNREYERGNFPGRFIAKKLFGWNNKRYNREYWERLNRNWRKWKGTRPWRQRRLV